LAFSKEFVMVESRDDCSAQALQTAAVKALSTFLTTGDPINAAREGVTTYAAARAVCEMNERPPDNSKGGKKPADG
jgi:hypothetical protein